mgnify:CR=1 FL=1|jgi:hypothetical protein
MSTQKSTTKDGRYRQWTIVVYPESAPENWRNLLNGQTWIESPLHDKDVNPDGTEKKSHWHILIAFDGKKSYEQVKLIADSLNGASPQYVQNMVGMVRYLAHIDNPEKAQYDPKKIIGYGIDVDKYLKNAIDIDNLICEVEEFIDEHKIIEYAKLTRVARMMREEHPDWHKIISTHTIHFKAYVNSCRHAPAPTETVEDLAAESEKDF